MLPSMTRELFFCLLAIALCAPAGACSGGTETGNPPFQAELSYTAYSSMPSLISVREQSSQAVVESAWLDLDSVSLIGADGCAEVEPRSLSVPALGIGDHASGQHNATVFFAAGSDYCALELPFALAPPSGVLEGVPADLARHSIMLAGALADGTRFTLLSAETPREHWLSSMWPSGSLIWIGRKRRASMAKCVSPRTTIRRSWPDSNATLPAASRCIETQTVTASSMSTPCGSLTVSDAIESQARERIQPNTLSHRTP